MATKRRQNQPKQRWLKERPPTWAIGIFAALAAVVIGLFVWGAFYEGG